MGCLLVRMPRGVWKTPPERAPPLVSIWTIDGSTDWATASSCAWNWASAPEPDGDGSGTGLVAGEGDATGAGDAWARAWAWRAFACAVSAAVAKRTAGPEQAASSQKAAAKRTWTGVSIGLSAQP